MDHTIVWGFGGIFEDLYYLVKLIGLPYSLFKTIHSCLLKEILWCGSVWSKEGQLKKKWAILWGGCIAGTGFVEQKFSRKMLCLIWLNEWMFLLAGSFQGTPSVTVPFICSSLHLSDPSWNFCRVSTVSIKDAFSCLL